MRISRNGLCCVGSWTKNACSNKRKKGEQKGIRCIAYEFYYILTIDNLYIVFVSYSKGGFP